MTLAKPASMSYNLLENMMAHETGMVTFLTLAHAQNGLYLASAMNSVPYHASCRWNGSFCACTVLVLLPLRVFLLFFVLFVSV